jgi:hypothetical protein
LPFIVTQTTRQFLHHFNLSRGHLAETGHTCELQNSEFFETSEGFRHYIVENKFCCVIGIHLWRAGKFLLGVEFFQ